MVLGRQCDVSLLDSKTSVGNFEVNSALKDYTYVDLSVCIPSHLTANHESSLNMKETELRLGLPGSQSPSRDHLEPDEKPFFPLCPLKGDVASALFKHVASGNKRGFSQTEGTVFPEENWVFPSTLSEIESEKLVSQNVPDPVIKRTGIKESLGDKVTSCGTKAQVVGWPPIRSFRKNTLAKNSKSIEDVKGKTYSDALFVKVSMDGAPYLRKIDLKAYSTYHGLSSTLEKMFSCFIIDQCGSRRSSEQKVIIENNLNDLRYVSKYMLTYEDKDGDWMLVGDVPWEMFIDSCKRLRIMKSTDAIGLGNCFYLKSTFSEISP